LTELDHKRRQLPLCIHLECALSILDWVRAGGPAGGELYDAVRPLLARETWSIYPLGAWWCALCHKYTNDARFSLRLDRGLDYNFTVVYTDLHLDCLESAYGTTPRRPKAELSIESDLLAELELLATIQLGVP